MKKFTLGCENEHEFEGWFADADAIRKQAASGLLDCPFCASTKIEKRLSAPNLSTPKTKARIVGEQQKSADNVPAPLSPPPASAAPSAVLAGSSSGEGAAALRMAVRALQKKIQTEFTNVGDKFADEARKIHKGESDQQNIYGTCTADEQRELAEDGIDILPLPDLPPEH